MQFLFVTNIEFFRSNCRLSEEKTNQGDDEGNDDNEKQEVHYADDLTQFMQQRWEITYN